MRLALDTNILAYAEGVNGAAGRKAALAILERLPQSATFIPVQALGELFAVLVRKAGRTPKQARSSILSWQEAFPLIETSHSVLLTALDLAAAHQTSVWDSIILSAAAAAGCRFLLSEDLQHGFTWSGVTIVNPFAEGKELLQTVLE